MSVQSQAARPFNVHSPKSTTAALRPITAVLPRFLNLKPCHGTAHSQAFSKVCSLLLSDLCETGQKLSIRPGKRRCVSNGVDIVEPYDTKMIVNRYPTAGDTG